MQGDFLDEVQLPGGDENGGPGIIGPEGDLPINTSADASAGVPGPVPVNLESSGIGDTSTVENIITPAGDGLISPPTTHFVNAGPTAQQSTMHDRLKNMSGIDFLLALNSSSWMYNIPKNREDAFASAMGTGLFFGGKSMSWHLAKGYSVLGPYPPKGLTDSRAYQLMGEASGVNFGIDDILMNKKNRWLPVGGPGSISSKTGKAGNVEYKRGDKYAAGRRRWQQWKMKQLLTQGSAGPAGHPHKFTKKELDVTAAAILKEMKWSEMEKFYKSHFGP